MLSQRRLIILTVVSYWLETWPLSSKEEQILQMFENKDITKMSGPKTGEVTGQFRIYKTGNFVIYMCHLVLLDRTAQEHVN
jgi:hypothetical protein